MCVGSLQGKSGIVTVRVSEAAQNPCPALVGTRIPFHLHASQHFVELNIFNFLSFFFFALWEYITEARRQGKTASILTVSSDDLEDEPGFLPTFSFICKICYKTNLLSGTQLANGFINLLHLPAEYNDGQPAKVRQVSRAALSHRLKKMKSKMAKCKQCENYIVVSGVECEEVRLHV